jgi:aldehyde dehydrogenase (NAD+)
MPGSQPVSDPQVARGQPARRRLSARQRPSKLSVLSHAARLGVADGQIFVAGAWRDAEGAASRQHVNPASGEVVTSLAEASANDVSAAVTAARDAFDNGPWPRMKARERFMYMRRIADGIRSQAERLTALQSLDNAIPCKFGGQYRTSGEFAADLFEHFAGWIDKLDGRVHPAFTDEVPLQAISMREPRGVVAALTPSNAPLLQVPNKLAPALACGCTVILKPSEYASLVAIEIAKIVAAADLPPGVFQVVTGGTNVGQALVDDRRIDLIAFTGSEGVGSKILQASADGIRRTFLELGGKSAAIVFPDADIEAAATRLMANCSTFLSGQICSIPTRALVHRSIYQDFIDHASRQLDTVVLGDPFDPATTSAPLIHAAARERVERHLAQLSGARLVLGGQRPNGPLSNGFWLQPTLVMDVSPDNALFNEELFGPVLTVTPFDSEDEAIAMANASRYGLGGMVFTESLSRAWRVARRVRTGTIGINGYSYLPNAPFGGVKASGIGREGGWGAIEAYTETKTIMFPVDRADG